MTKSALQEVASYSLLNDIFEEYYSTANKAKRERCDSENQSLNSFKRNKVKFLKKISQDIKNEEYEFSKLQPYFLKKDNGKLRIICAPTIRDKIIQKATLSVLYKKNYRFNNSVNYGFIAGAGGGVKAAIERAVELRNSHPFVYKTDIISFFDRIDRRILKSDVSKNIKVRSLHEIIFKMIDVEIDTRDKGVARKIKEAGIKKGEGLRQGMPISPYLSNLLLKKFDDAIIEKKMNAVRYADDLIFFANTEEACHRYHHVVRDSLRYLHLEIPDLMDESKTKVYYPDEVVEFLGLGIEKRKDNGYRVVLTNEQRQMMKDKLGNLGNVNFCIENNVTISKLLGKVNSIIDGYLYYYDGIEDLEGFSSIKASLLDSRKMVIVNLLKNGLNQEICFNDLTKKQKKFWEIDV